MGFASRTDKAHSQNGCTQTASCRCDCCLPRKLWSRGSERNALQREIDATLIEQMGFEPITLPGLKRMGKRNAQIAARPVNRFYALDTWREVALSDCDFGCKVYERNRNGVTERQVQHSRIYGCRNTVDGPIETVGERLNVFGWNKPKPEPKIQRHMPKRRPVTQRSPQPVGNPNGKPSEGSLPRVGGSRGKHYAQMDVPTPSLMQLAKARQASMMRGEGN